MRRKDDLLKDVQFLDMQLKHLEQVQAIEASAFPTPWTLQSFEHELVQNDFAVYIVAQGVNDEVFGYAGMWIILDEAHVTNVATRTDFRGRGLGSALMLEIMGRAVRRGVTKMTLEVRPSNHVARHLYGKLGFVEKGIRKSYYDDTDEDAIIMWKYHLARF